MHLYLGPATYCPERESNRYAQFFDYKPDAQPTEQRRCKVKSRWIMLRLGIFGSSDEEQTKQAPNTFFFYQNKKHQNDFEIQRKWEILHKHNKTAFKSLSH